MVCNMCSRGFWRGIIMLARVIAIWATFFPIVAAICFWMIVRSIKKLIDDYMDRVKYVCLYLNRIKDRMDDLEKEIEDRWRWSQPKPEVRAKMERKTNELR